MPMARFWLFTLLSFPVDFQYPARVARFVLNPFGYFRSLGPKKYHSGSLLGKKDFSTNINKQSFQMTWSFYAQINFATYVIRRKKKKKKKNTSIALLDWSITCQFPGLAFVEIDFGDDIELDFLALDFPLEVIVDKFFISGMESKTWRQSNWGHADRSIGIRFLICTTAVFHS